MDETPCCLWQGEGVGNVFEGPEPGPLERRRRQQVPRGLSRTFLTYLAFLCDDAAIHPLLPQVIIGSSNTLRVRAMASYNAQVPNEQWYVLRGGTSHWTTGDLMIQVCALLATILLEVCPDAFVIWYLDCASSHLEDPFLAFARACGFHLVIVPTHTTFLLQVLDVFFFRRFKAALRRLFRHMQTVMNVVRLRVEAYLQLV